MSKIFIYLYIIFLGTNEMASYIALPLKILPKENYVFSKDNSEKSIIKQYFYDDIYTTFLIGDSHQKIPIFLSVSSSVFQITSSLSRKFLSLEEPEIYLYESKKKFFNEKDSNSFRYNNEIILDNKKSCLGNDTIVFYNNLNIKNSLELTMNFELLQQFQKENIPGEIGLSLPDKNDNNYNIIKKCNILSQLKENNFISNYNWFLLYDRWNNTEGKLVIGILPHDLFPKKYSKKDLFFAKPEIDSPSGHNWKLKFRDIFSDKFYLKNLTTELIFDSEAIVAPKELDTLLLKIFLQEHINNKNCFQGYYYLRNHYITSIKYYYCDKNIQKEIYEAMPNIKFNSKEFNYTFELNKNDLIKNEEKYIFFKIMFFIEDGGIWLLGKPFTLKYQFVFNPYNKEIGFYNPDYVYEKTNKWNSKQIWLIFAITLLCVILNNNWYYYWKENIWIKKEKKS